MAARSGVSRRRTRADGVWKRVLTDLLPDCLAFAVPELHAAVDWATPPLSLDKEFQAITRQMAVGQRVADHLVQLRLRSGATTWLPLHVEVQGQPQDDFAARMFTYYALLHLRLWRRRGREGVAETPLILGLALLTDGQVGWRPGPYAAQGFGQGLRYDYWVIKLLDWRGREAALATSANPFALIVLAWLGQQAARGQTASLVATTRAILRQLRRGGYDDEETVTILAFLEEVMALPTSLQEQLHGELEHEGEEIMAQVTSSFERSGMRKGRQEAYQETVLALLGHKFGPLDEPTLGRVQGLAGRKLLALFTATLDFSERADLDRWLDEQGA